MSKLSWTIFTTFVTWLLGTILYGYYWVTATLAERGLGGYEREPLLPMLSFAVYRLPYLLIALVIIIVVELLIVPKPDPELPSMV